MGNLDFTNHAGFSWYCLFLMFSGIALLVISVLRAHQTRQSRVLNALFGIGFFGYGFYLTFIWAGVGSYWIFPYAFILPIVLIVRSFRRDVGRQRAQLPPVAASVGNVPPPNLQPMVDPGPAPMADPGLPPMDPGLPPAPRS